MFRQSQMSTPTSPPDLLGVVHTQAPYLEAGSAMRLFDLVSGLSRAQWRHACQARGIRQSITHAELIASFVTETDFELWTTCVRETASGSSPSDASGGAEDCAAAPFRKRFDAENPVPARNHGLANGHLVPVTLDDMALSPWFGFELCAFLTTKDKVRVRTADCSCLEMVKLHSWYDMDTRFALPLAPSWRACFPFAHGAAVLPGQEITDDNVRPLAGLRRLILDAPVWPRDQGRPLSDAGFAHFAGLT